MYSHVLIRDRYYSNGLGPEAPLISEPLDG